MRHLPNTAGLLCAALCFLLATPSRAGEPAEEYRPAIKPIEVNGERISAGDIGKIYDEWLERYKAPGKKIANELKDKLLEKSREQAAYHAAVRQYIAKNKLAVSPEILKEELAALKDDLAAEGNDFQKLLNSLKKSEAEFSVEYAPRAALRRYVAAQLASDEETAALKKKFDEGRDKIPFRRASHILISFEKCKFTTHPERKKEDALALGKAALERALKGDDFAELVKEFTDDTRTKDKAGDLEWLRPADMPKPFSDALYALEKVNDSTKDLVESDLGFHIIRLTGLRSEDGAFKKFVQLAVKTRTMELENKLYKESKIEAVKE